MEADGQTPLQGNQNHPGDTHVEHNVCPQVLIHGKPLIAQTPVEVEEEAKRLGESIYKSGSDGEEVDDALETWLRVGNA